MISICVCMAVTSVSSGTAAEAQDTDPCWNDQALARVFCTHL